MDKIEYRKAEDYDVEILTSLRIKMLCEGNNYNMSFIEKMRLNTNEYFKNELANGNYISWLALINKNIIGMCGITFFKISPNDWCLIGKTGYIGNMYTEKEYRRKGIAKNLLIKIIEEGKMKKCERILLDTTEMGKDLYKKCGFKYSKTKMAYYPFGIDCKKMEL
jgi:ribosomal protein S18 acetylase RimI-like enzyme